MKKLLLVFLPFILLLFSPTFVLAQEARPSNIRSGDVVTVTENEVIDRDFFASGQLVEILGTINGDAYLGGGKVVIKGVVNGDLLVAGGTIEISGKVDQDVRAAGGQITVSGEVGKNITAGAGSLEITSDGKVGGSLVAGTGSLNLAGPVGGDVMVGAGSFTATNTIGGDLNAGVGSADLAEGALVGGDFIYFSDTQTRVNDKASVSGKVIQKTPPEALKNKEQTAIKLAGIASGVLLAIKLISTLALLVVGLLLVRFHPKFMQETVKTLRKRTGRSIVAGLIFIVATPIVIVALLISIIGIPLALILLAFYLILLYVAKLTVILWMGYQAFEKTKTNAKAGWAMVGGMLIYFLLTLLPGIGRLIGITSLIFGMGAFILTKKQAYSKGKK